LVKTAKSLFVLVCLLLATMTPLTALAADDDGEDDDIKASEVYGDYGTIGNFDSFRLSIAGGPIGLDPTLDGQDQEAAAAADATDGMLWLAAMRGGKYFGATRYAHLMGLESGLMLGRFNDAAVGDTESMWGNWFFEFDMTLALMLFDWGFVRVSVLPGAGFNSDYGFLEAGVRTTIPIYGGVALTADAYLLPLAHSYSGNTVREWRASAELIIPGGDDGSSYGLGASLRRGGNPVEITPEDRALYDSNPDRVREEDAVRGHYEIMLFYLSMRWR
jgi:hypothetical protein